MFIIGINALIVVFGCLLWRTQASTQAPFVDIVGSRFAYEYKLMERFVRLQNENAQLAERVAALENSQSKKHSRVSTHVRLSKTTHLAGTDRVMYDVEVSNIGNAYNLNEGHFDTPVSGLYLIHVNVCLNSGGKWIDLNIIKDGGIIGRVFSGDSAYHNCGSTVISIHLQSGEKVWVSRTAGIATNLNQDHGWNTLTIVLLQQD